MKVMSTPCSGYHHTNQITGAQKEVKTNRVISSSGSQREERKRRINNLLQRAEDLINQIGQIRQNLEQTTTLNSETQSPERIRRFENLNHRAIELQRQIANAISSTYP